jgi:hypothetical protein
MLRAGRFDCPAAPAGFRSLPRCRRRFYEVDELSSAVRPTIRLHPGATHENHFGSATGCALPVRSWDGPFTNFLQRVCALSRKAIWSNF